MRNHAAFPFVTSWRNLCYLLSDIGLGFDLIYRI